MLRFDGVAQYLVVDDFPAQTDWDVFAVWQSPVSPSTTEITNILRFGTLANETNIELTHGHFWETFRGGATRSSGGFYDRVLFEAPATDRLYLWNATLDSSAGLFETRTNTTATNSFNFPPAPPDLASNALGVGGRPDGMTFFPGDIGEILIYSRPLSLSERATTEAYLSAKWGF
jgi:hypothetical protein